MAKKHLGNKSAQNRRHYLRYKKKILARNKANYEAGREVALARFLATKKTEKGRARQRVRDAIKAGKLARDKACQLCLKECRTHAHHHDYSKPLEVTWVCTQCHGKIHSNIGV